MKNLTTTLFLFLLCLQSIFVFAQKPIVIINNGFEDGLKNWEVKGKVQKSQDVNTGGGSAKLAEKGAEIHQYVRVEPKKDYILRVAVKGNANVFVTVKGKRQEKTITNKKFEVVEIAFNSGKAKNISIGAEYNNGQSRLDDFSISAVTEPANENEDIRPILIVNNGFEERFKYWNISGDVSPSNVVKTGEKSAKMKAKGEIKQTVKVYPNQEYTLTAAVKGKGQLFAVVKGEEITQDFNTEEFEEISLSFASNAKTKNITIGGRYTEKEVRFDDFKITIHNLVIDPNYQYPSDVIPSLTDWKVTLPINALGEDNRRVLDVDQRIKTPLEVADKAIVDFEYKPYFYAKDGEVFFRAHCAGATTKGSKYPRSELRQRSGHGNLYWSVNDPQFLQTELRVTHLPQIKSNVCITQIHGPDDEPLRVHYSKKKGVYIVWNENNKDYENALDYNLGEQLRITVNVDKGFIACEIENLDQKTKYKKIWKSMDSTGYFKVGCYTQASKFQSQIKKTGVDEPYKSYGEVAVKSIILKTTYTPKDK
ncbi:hypothetical protein EI427_16295 [Flammeovirga pectinis]|uniref:Alginate lyase 2 domain-containing protein n=1 Tax=Flammeovirga pectinis TaxID=2494373 RepID=A0A3S9P686_9BACT|nr:polysaccharide lyase family 7 protein [Flammeovirga pectinis]AZQ63727.1 hypothetical protein EI427_16295 [Flammeovirga pectinis]